MLTERLSRELPFKCTMPLACTTAHNAYPATPTQRMMRRLLMFEVPTNVRAALSGDARIIEYLQRCFTHNRILADQQFSTVRHRMYAPPYSPLVGAGERRIPHYMTIIWRQLKNINPFVTLALPLEASHDDDPVAPTTIEPTTCKSATIMLPTRHRPHVPNLQPRPLGRHPLRPSIRTARMLPAR
jgi:hypothetical protein